MGIRSYEHTRSVTDVRSQEPEPGDATAKPCSLRPAARMLLASVTDPLAAGNRRRVASLKEKTGASPVAKTLFTFARTGIRAQAPEAGNQENWSPTPLTSPLSHQ